MRTAHNLGWAALALAIGFTITGCGTPAAPMPPSLNLPEPVTDLSASRTGDQVSLTWTMPKKNTDKLLLKGTLPARLCRKEDAVTCVPVPGDLRFAPGAPAAFTETLPPAIAAGPPRPLVYLVELPNRNRRSAGPSNPAIVLAGEAPPPVANLSAQVRKGGVALRWSPDSSSDPQLDHAAIRLHRKLLTPPPNTRPKAQPGLLTPPPEPVEQTLLVDFNPQGRALDKEIRFGETYEYRAQRVVRVTVGGQSLELPGPLSDPIRVEALDVFPPAVPTSLAAVATAATTGTEAAIDLSWQPDTEADLAGYVVYRREGADNWQRISPAQPLVGPAFHDAGVLPGLTYRYAVTAISQSGHESARSAETEETVPTP